MLARYLCGARIESPPCRVGGVRRCPLNYLVWCAAVVLSLAAALPAQVDTPQLIRASVAATEADWKRAPDYSYTERDENRKDGEASSKTYRVSMIDGSPYSRLIAVDNEPLSPQQQKEQQEKLQVEIARRASESPQSRAKRVEQYQKGRQRMFALLGDMADAFHFERAGEQVVAGHQTDVLRATPRPGFVPQSRVTKILTGMQGTLWIDKDSHRWVKVEAEAVKPVWMGWVFAKVLPGTRFLLAQSAIDKDLWLPQHFSVQVKLRILVWQRDLTYTETYWDYHLGGAERWQE